VGEEKKKRKQLLGAKWVESNMRGGKRGGTSEDGPLRGGEGKKGKEG